MAALAFSPSGEALAAWTPAERTLRVWLLVAKWSNRLQRSPAVLVPSKARSYTFWYSELALLLEDVHYKCSLTTVKVVACWQVLRLGTPYSSQLVPGVVDFCWTVLWQTDTMIEVFHGQECIGRAAV